MKKLLLILTLILALVSSNLTVFAQGDTVSVISAPEFTDVSGHWAEESINRVVDKDLFGGNEGKFLPDAAITRSEFVLMLHKALKININYFKATDIAEFYSDVKNEEVYASALYDLVTANIIDYKDQFKPNSTLTREEMVHFIMNADKYKMGDSYKQIKLAVKPFADDSKIDPLYSGDIRRAEYFGITIRPASDKFFPKDLATRAQAATVIDRLLRLLEKETLQVQVTPAAERKDGLIKMKLTITNNLKTPIVIQHTSGQRFDFALLDANGEILYTWSADKSFIMALTETVIEPGKTVEFSDEVQNDLYDGILEKAVNLKAYIIGTTNDFTINADGYETGIK